MENKTPRLKIAFFGTPNFAVEILEELKKGDIVTDLIITNEDKPQGRKLIITPPPVKVWGEQNNIEIFQPKKLDSGAVKKLKGFDLLIVAAYGNILPKEILDIPKHGTLNVHPSLLPKFRGSSPVESAILEGDEETGVSIMLLDELMDHGPILDAQVITLNGEERGNELESKLAKLGGQILAEIIPNWVAGEIDPQDQEHDQATYTQKIKKSDGLINLDDDPELNYRKIRAFDGWPGTYFFVKKNNKEIRVVIKETILKDGQLKILRVIPEGRKEIDYDVFIKDIT